MYSAMLLRTSVQNKQTNSVILMTKCNSWKESKVCNTELLKESKKPCCFHIILNMTTAEHQNFLHI